jgi:hypothetical protein
LPDEFFEAYLQTIETDIHTSKNRVRDAMNSAVINRKKSRRGNQCRPPRPVNIP